MKYYIMALLLMAGAINDVDASQQNNPKKRHMTTEIEEQEHMAAEIQKQKKCYRSANCLL